MKTIDVKVNKDIPDYQSGRTVSVGCDDNGVPLSRFWRRRLKDAETDQCCEIVVKTITKAARSKPIAKNEKEEENSDG